MADKLIDFDALTLNIEEARETADLVFEQNFVKGEVVDYHNIMTGVEMDKYIPIFGNFGLHGKVDPGGCSNNDEEGEIPVSQKQWSPKLISFRRILCAANIPDLLKFWKKARIAANTWSEVNNEMLAFVTDKINEAIKESIFRITSFGDTAATAVGAGTGTETLTAGTDKTYFNMLNGLWKQILVDQAGAKLIYRHTLTANAQATKTAQMSLGETDCYDAMVAMYQNLAPEAWKAGNVSFQMTKTMVDNYYNFLEKKSGIFTLEVYKNGLTNLTFRGIPIKQRNDWDHNIRMYFDNGTTYDMPHRIILGDPNLMPIGTSDTESLTSLKSHYDDTTEKHYMKSAYKIDIKILIEKYFAVAY